jgi:hypothetical protein
MLCTVGQKKVVPIAAALSFCTSAHLCRVTLPLLLPLLLPPLQI